MKLLYLAFSCAAVFGILGSPSDAQNTREYELATSDQELNQAYASLMRRLGPSDKASLRISQRLWIQFRDADCKLAIADVRDCLMERTVQRTEQLRSTYYSDENGDVFSLSDS